MPLYEYECETCGHRFEIIQKFSDPPVETCPACGGAVHKLLSSPAIQFKGSGWYITDYARAGKSDGASASSGDAAKGESGKSESAKGDTAASGGGSSSTDGASATSGSKSEAKAAPAPSAAKSS